MLPFRLVYHDGYDLNIGAHVFPAIKYRKIHDRLLADGIAEQADFVEPTPATGDDLLLAHDAGWIRRLRTGTLSMMEVLKLEIPYSRKMVDAFVLAAGGTILSAQLALREGIGFNIGGGFHHAFYGHGEGFCAINDIAVAIRRMQADHAIRQAMVVDCDNHHGNGTAAIFAGDPSVLTFSIHQFANYPAEKPPSDIDIHLEDETGDERYLEMLGARLRPAIGAVKPELIVYVAGADPYLNDQLGGLSLTMEGLRHRDDLVLTEARRAGIPVAITLAGGYAVDVEDTVTIHVNTVLAARDAAGSA